MADGTVPVKKHAVWVPMTASPPAYHLPAWCWPILRQHEALCDDCEHVVAEAHDCPDCECEDEWWDHCDVWWRLYNDSKVPTVDASGRHLTEDEALRRSVRKQFSRFSQAIATSLSRTTEERT